MFPAVKALNDHLSQGGFEVPGSQSDQVKKDIDTLFSKQSNRADLLVMHSGTLVATDPQFKEVAVRTIAALRLGPGVASSKIIDPYSAPDRFISSDGHTLTASIGI